jgi:hypothetical protein
MVESGALRKLVIDLAFVAAHVDEILRDARLISVCKVLEEMTTLLFTTFASAEELFLDDMRSVPGKNQNSVNIPFARV